MEAANQRAADMETSHMAYNPEGHTPAGWTTVILIVIGFVIGGLAVMDQNWPLFWIGGAGVVVVAGIVGKVMQMMGLGQYPRPEGLDSAEAADGAAREGIGG